MADQATKIDDSKGQITRDPVSKIDIADVNELKQLIANSVENEANYVAARKDERIKWQADIDLLATVGVTPKADVVVDPGVIVNP